MKKEDDKTMRNEEPATKEVSLWYALLSLALTVVAIVIGIKMSFGTQMAIFFGAIVTIFMAMIHRTKWEDIQEQALKNVQNCATPIMILILVGILVGVWLIGGVIPTLIYYGLEFISPKAIVPLTFLLCALTSIFTGTSLGSVATMGLAMFGVGYNMGIEPTLIAGAVVSGSLLGDKMSPLSDTTNIAPAMAGTDLYSHIGSMFYTTLPATVVALILYIILGLRYSSSAYDTSTIVMIQETLAENFNINLLCLLPLILVLVLSACKVSSVLAMGISVVVSVFLALFTQSSSISSIMTAGMSGYTSTTGVSMVDTILSRGGVSSMVGSIAIMFFASFMAGAMQASGILDALVKVLLKFVKSVKSLVVSTLVFCWAMVMMTGNQTVGIIVPAKAMGDIYDKLDVNRKVLSRCTEDAATIGAAIIPWSVMSAYITSVLDVGLGYIPFAFLCYIVPVFSIICAFTGFGIWNSAGEPVWKKEKAQAQDMEKA